MEETVSYLLMLKNIYQFKTKDSEINDYTLCLGSIWKDLRVNNMKKKTGLKASVKFFSVDFNPTDTLKITWKGHDIK